ncbi:hypothetical protein PAXRUDRAFT_135057, partial [Paxillus rubicundulus Ve08.2h10]
KLLHHVKIHWDSTYYMINHLCALQQVVSYFLDAPCNADIADHKMLPLGWEVPFHAQWTMCRESIPLIGGAFPSYETFLTQWTSLSLACDHPQLVSFISSGLELANHYHDHLGHIKAYLFAMCKSSYYYNTIYLTSILQKLLTCVFNYCGWSSIGK